jgi:hypothetical protein
MSAKNGSMRSFRLLGCLMAVTLLASALFASTASAKKAEPTNPTAYINLGDSVSYGYTNEKFVLNAPSEPPSAFEGGYPNLVAAKLAKKEVKLGNKLSLINLACPGETSKGLIGNGPVSEQLLAEAETSHFTGGEAPCGWHNSSGLPRHFEYGTVSQLEAAAGIVKASAEKTGPEVKDITLQIGSNDELHKLGECASPAYDEAHGFMSFIECVTVEAKNTLFPTILTNIGDTIGVLRHAGYAGPISILGFYNPQAYLVPTSDTLQSALNAAAEETIAAGSYGPGVTYANPFKKTNARGKKSQTEAEKTAIEKAAICTYTEECNKFDRKLNQESKLKHAVSTEEEEAIEAEAASKGIFLEGDIHPTPAGDALFAKLIGSALKKA